MRRDLSIIGYYTSNFGDLLMLRGLVSSISYKYDHVYILTYGKLSSNDVKGLGVCENKFTIVNLYSKHKTPFALLKALLFSKAIIWGGGTCFNSHENAYGGIKYMRLFHKAGVKVNYIGVGINTNKKNVYLVTALKEALSVSDNFIVRDKESLNFIKKEIDITYNQLEPDLVFLNKMVVNKNEEREKVLFLSYRCVDDYYNKASEYRDLFINNILCILKRELFNKVIVYPSDREVDYFDNCYIATELKKRADSVKIDFADTMDISKVISTISKCSMVITGRLHVGVISASLGIPFQLLNYSSKNRAFVKDFDFNAKTLVEFEDLVDDTRLCSNAIELKKCFCLPAGFPPNIDNLSKRLTILSSN